MGYEVTDFSAEVLERSKTIPVVVDFWADWCGPCKVLGPILERLASMDPSAWVLAKVDTEAHRDVAAQYNIRSIPNVKLFHRGSAVAEFTGALPEHMVRQWLHKHIPGKFSEDIAEAGLLVTGGRLAEAQKILYRVFEGEPGNQDGLVLLAKTVLFSDPGKATLLVRDIQPGAQAFDKAEAIRTMAEFLQKEALAEGSVKQTYQSALDALRQSRFPEALEMFVGVIRTDRYYDDDGARRACIAIFKYLGEENEITQKYRREFSRALY